MSATEVPPNFMTSLAIVSSTILSPAERPRKPARWTRPGQTYYMAPYIMTP